MSFFGVILFTQCKPISNFMNEADFNKLNGLLSKLENVTDKAAKEDGSFRKYHSSSISSIKAMRANLKVIEHGLRTAKYVTEKDTTNQEPSRAGA